MNVPSKTTTVYILKHIMALSTMLLRILMKCHRLYIRLEYYFFSVIVFGATFCCLFARTNQSKGTILFFSFLFFFVFCFFVFETKAVSEMANLTLQ